MRHTKYYDSTQESPPSGKTGSTCSRPLSPAAHPLFGHNFCSTWSYKPVRYDTTRRMPDTSDA